MERTAATDALCKEAWNQSLQCFATAKIFLARARKYQLYITAISVLGILVPAVVGGILVAYGTTWTYLPYVIAAAVVLGLIQLVLSVLALILNWPGGLQYSQESGSDNLELSDLFRLFAMNPPSNQEVEAAKLNTRNLERTKQDSRQHVSDKELRRGHREGLRQFQRECSGCLKTPRDMESTDCAICGRFKWTIW